MVVECLLGPQMHIAKHSQAQALAGLSSIILTVGHPAIHPSTIHLEK